MQTEEEVLHHLVVVAGHRSGEQVVGEAEALQILDDHPVVLVGGLAGGQSLALGLHQDRRAVLVGAGDHQHVIPAHPHEPGEDVGRDPETGDMTDVPRTVGVRPGDCGQHA